MGWRYVRVVLLLTSPGFTDPLKSGSPGIDVGEVGVGWR